MTESQKQWVETMRSMGNNKVKAKPRAGKGFFAQSLFALVTAPAFARIISWALLANLAVLCADHWGLDQPMMGEPATWYSYELHQTLKLGFNLIFYLEASCKLYAFGVAFYLKYALSACLSDPADAIPCGGELR